MLAAGYDGDFTDEDGNLAGNCQQGVCYPYNTDFAKASVDLQNQVRHWPACVYRVFRIGVAALHLNDSQGRSD